MGYNPKSCKAEEFINHEEILETLAYADENSKNLELIDKLIDKAALRKGLSHREASVLLACQDPERNERIFKLAEQIKKDFYGNRIVMFAPLYLSNYCVNGCTYCPYQLKNKHIGYIYFIIFKLNTPFPPLELYIKIKNSMNNNPTALDPDLVYNIKISVAPIIII